MENNYVYGGSRKVHVRGLHRTATAIFQPRNLVSAWHSQSAKPESTESQDATIEPDPNSPSDSDSDISTLELPPTRKSIVSTHRKAHNRKIQSPPRLPRTRRRAIIQKFAMEATCALPGSFPQDFKSQLSLFSMAESLPDSEREDLASQSEDASEAEPPMELQKESDVFKPPPSRSIKPSNPQVNIVILVLSMLRRRLQWIWYILVRLLGYRPWRTA